MNYSTLDFLLAFPLFCALFWAIRSRHGRLIALLAASLLFYVYGEPSGLPLLLATIALAYAAGILVAASPRHAGLIVAGAVAVLLLDLAAFKYAGFIGSLVGAQPLPVSAVIPLGISFFTFEAIAYLVDLKRGVTTAERSPLRLGLYVAVFPHLISGPIMRPNDILPQLRADRRFDLALFVSGIELFIEGFVKKRLIADTAGIVVDHVFGAPASASTLAAWTAALAYTIQIYGDFAGYTDMGRGIARMLGLELPVNFRSPYTATSIGDFWRRWHITLSSWLRDYLYIPLGGNRHGRTRMYASLLITMLLGGLWHGAGLTYVVWGGYHGMLLAVERAWPIRMRIPKLVAGALTLFLVINGWVLFRARDFAIFSQMLNAMYQPRAGTSLPPSQVLLVLLAFVLVVALMVVQRLRPATIEGMRRPDALRGVAYGLAAAAVLLAAPTAAQPFIYFRF